MDDTCVITRDYGNPNDSQDDVLDETTMVLSPPNPAALTVYTGKCKFSPLLTSEPRYAHEGEGVEEKRFYNFSLPVTAPRVRVGDKIKITSSRRDQSSVGRFFHVREVVINSWKIQQKLICEYRDVI